MGFDLAAAGLIDLFSIGAAEAAPIAAEAVPAVADIGGAAAADLVAPAAVDLAAGTTADIGAAAAGGVASDLTAAAPDVGGALAGATGAADLLPAGVDIAAAGDLGTAIGGGATDALGGDAISPSEAVLNQAQGALGFTGGTPPPIAGASADVGGGVLPASQELATGNPNIAAELGTAPPAVQTEPTTAATAFQEQSIPNAGAPFSGGAAAPAADAAAAAPAAGGSLTDTLGGALNSPWTKAAELGLPLGLIGYNLAKGPPGLPSTAQAAIGNAQASAAPLTSAATANVPLFNQTAAQDLNLANNFQISPAQAASINTWKQDQYNQLYQQIANEGNANPQSTSQWVQGKNQIDQQALAQQVQMVNQLVTTAFQASSAANAGISTAGNITSQTDATLMQAAQIQVQQDAAFQQSVGSALQAFGLIAALSGRFGGTPATQPTG